MPSLAALGLEDDDATFDPDWWPSALAAFSSPPSRWRLLLFPFSVAAIMIAVAGIVLLLLTVLSRPEGPEAEDVGMLSARAPAQSAGSGFLWAAATPKAIPVASPASVMAYAVDLAADPLRATRRGGDNQRAESPRVPKPPRLDDPVLIWLPEIMAAAEETGVSPSLIAGVIRVESRGDPDAVSPHGARGLMQVMPEHLVKQGVPEHQWNDPAINILAGARLLQWHIEVHGTQWDGVARYFGIGCDGFNCTDAYVADVFVVKEHYAPLIADPYGSGLEVLPDR